VVSWLIVVYEISTLLSWKIVVLKLGLKLGKELKRIPNKFCLGFFLISSPTSPRYTNLTSTKLIYNTKRSSDKQNESVNVRPKRMANTRLTTWDPRNCPGWKTGAYLVQGTRKQVPCKWVNQLTVLVGWQRGIMLFIGKPKGRSGMISNSGLACILGLSNPHNQSL